MRIVIDIQDDAEVVMPRIIGGVVMAAGSALHGANVKAEISLISNSDEFDLEDCYTVHDAHAEHLAAMGIDFREPVTG